MKKLLLLLTLSVSVFLLGCKNNKDKDSAISLLDLINQYGNENTGCVVLASGSCHTIKYNLGNVLGNEGRPVNLEFLENSETHADGRVVFKNLDQKYGEEYLGINVNDFDNLLSRLEGLSNQLKAKTILTYILGSIEVLTPAGKDHFTFINDQGNPELYSENTSSVKDLEGLAAKLENQTTEILSYKLSAQYGLSNDRAEVVAKNIFAYNKLSSKRALTKKEKDFFANELLGANYDQVMNSFSSGVGVENLLEKAADVNGTSPEQVSTIINELFL